jgi:acyl-coenzyme A synthetase/AMP-(fatty) acid ligase
VLLVELDGGAAVPASLAEEIAVRVVERTGIRPYSVELLAPGTLPRTSSGKLRRLEARRQYVAGELTAPKAVTPLGLAGEVAKSYLAFARGRLPG